MLNVVTEYITKGRHKNCRDRHRLENGNSLCFVIILAPKNGYHMEGKSGNIKTIKSQNQSEHPKGTGFFCFF